MGIWIVLLVVLFVACIYKAARYMDKWYCHSWQYRDGLKLTLCLAIALVTLVVILKLVLIPLYTV